MKSKAETPEKEGSEAKSEQQQPTCPLCRSPLIGEAIRNGKCQCCGRPLEPAPNKENRA